MEDAASLLGRVIDMPFQVSESSEQFSGALELAQRFHHRNAYDMQYLAAAEVANAEIVTLDRGLRHAAEEIGVKVRFIR